MTERKSIPLVKEALPQKKNLISTKSGKYALYNRDILYKTIKKLEHTPISNDTERLLISRIYLLLNQILGLEPSSKYDHINTTLINATKAFLEMVESISINKSLYNITNILQTLRVK